MSGRIAGMSMDGTPVSQADIDRLRNEELRHDEHRRRAAQVVAAASHDLADCRLLLDILGLDRDVVDSARTELAARPAGDHPRAA